jgi:hypothetical protein
MIWSIALPNLSATHTGGLKVNLVPNGKSKYFLQAVEGTNLIWPMCPLKRPVVPNRARHSCGF